MCELNRRVTTAPSVCRYIYTVYVMSDSYLGLDQQYNIHLNVTPALRTELSLS